jgi:hypothetical protein
MLGGPIIKKTLAIAFVIISYMLLTSTIIDYRSEQKVAEAIINSAIQISDIKFGHQVSITEMEKEKTAEVINEKMAERLSGKLLLQTQLRGQLWYLNPVDQKRYYLGKENEAFRFIQRVVVSTSSEQMVEYEYFDKRFPKYLGGYFVTGNLEDICYIEPVTLNGNCFQTIDEAYDMIKEIALGVSNDDLRSIAVGDPFNPAKNNYE